jgi:hypothetical protein
MNTTRNIIKTFVIVLAAGVVVVALWQANSLVSRYLHLREQESFQQAIDSCKKVSTVTWKDANGSIIVEPYQSRYEQCLKDMGVQK